MDIFEKLSIIILPILVTAFFASIIPRKLKERQKFIEAANIFRNALINQSRIVKRTGFIKVSADDLDAAFTNSENAFLAFNSLLSDRKWKRINIMWNKYNNENKTHKEIVKFHTYDLLNGTDKNKLKENLLINIESLIECIKNK